MSIKVIQGVQLLAIIIGSFLICIEAGMYYGVGTGILVWAVMPAGEIK